MNDFSRRRFFHLAGALGAAASHGFRLNAQQQYPAPVPAPRFFPYTSRSPVSLVKGEVRRKNVLDALLAVDKEIRPAMARKKYVLIKINNVSTTNQLAATHVECHPRHPRLRGAALPRAPWSSPKPAAATHWRASPTTSTPRSSPNTRRSAW